MPSLSSPPRMSDILPLNLDEHPASGRGRYTTVSVLEPAVRIERTANDADASGIAVAAPDSAACYRIVLTFGIEVAISDFDADCFQKYNRFFDRLALRFLFRRGDEIDLHPHGDAAVAGLQVTRERDSTRSIQTGVSAGMTMAVVPELSVQAQRDFKLAYRRTMSSWRMGLSYESCCSCTRSATLALPDSNISRSDAGTVDSAFPSYNRAARWSWQTEAALRLWTPEVYASFQCPVTVARTVPVAVLDSASPALRTELLRFDFLVDTQLRALGCGSLWALAKTAFGPGIRRPAELRAQSDPGQPLPPDRLRFTVACCPNAIAWPPYPTRNLQAEAEAAAADVRAEHGDWGARLPRRLPTNAEFAANLLHQWHQKMTSRSRQEKKDDNLPPYPPFHRDPTPAPTPSEPIPGVGLCACGASMLSDGATICPHCHAYDSGIELNDPSQNRHPPNASRSRGVQHHTPTSDRRRSSVIVEQHMARRRRTAS